MNWIQNCFSLFICLFLASACVTPLREATPIGVQKAYKSYVPARSAVLACRIWPDTSNFPSNPRSQIGESASVEFCGAVDKHVLESFKGQVYMKGFTPSAVAKFLKDSQSLALLDKIPSLWRYDAESCQNCKDIPSFYEQVVKSRPEWRLWLAEFSQNTHRSDAVLIPFIASAHEERVNDRGLLFARREMNLVLLLIDTGSADLIWAGAQQRVLSSKPLPLSPDLKFPDYLPWSQVLEQILVNSLWRDYPGRIFY